MIFGQFMKMIKVYPDPDPHFRFFCEHVARADLALHYFLRRI